MKLISIIRPTTASIEALLSDRIEKARERLEEAREVIKALCEPVDPLKDTMAYLRYFCAKDMADKDANQPEVL